MKTLTNFEYHGKKARVGGLCFDEQDRMMVFVCYCDNCRGKIAFSRKEAECFSKQYIHQKNKLRTKIILKLAEKYAQ